MNEVVKRDSSFGLQFLENLDRINRVIQRAENMERMMTDLLDQILSVFDCDRAYLFYPCDPDADEWSVPMERTRPEYPGAYAVGAYAVGAVLPMSQTIADINRLLLDSPIPLTFGPENQYQVDDEVMDLFTVKSLLITPVYPKVDRPWQFGIQQCSRERVWTSDEIRLFQEIGRRLGDGLSSFLTLRDLQKSESMYRRIVDTADEGILVVSREHFTTFVNARMANLLGTTQEEMLGRRVLDFVFEEDHQNFLDKLENRFQGRSEKYELRLRRKDGEAVWTLISATPIYNDDGEVDGSFAMVTDITRLKTAEDELRQINEELENRVRERTRELELSYVDLKRSNAELDDFAYIVSHDLKEPLRSIHSFSGFLLEDYRDRLDEEGQSHLDIVMQSTKRMQSLLDDLLIYSRVGRAELAMQPTDLIRVTTEIVADMRVLLEEKNARVLVNENLPTVVCDHVRIGEVFRNLIQNSIKYNDSEEKIVEVSWISDGNGIPVFFVRDNGIGIREKHLENIFKIFKRLHGRDKYGGGTGSGLTIVRKIVERHGGKIWVESEFGKGSTFYFTLSQRS